jgi:hypothetical protein
MDFDDCPDDKEPFLQCSVSVHVQNKAEDLFCLALANLKDISRFIDIEMQPFYYAYTLVRKALERLFRHADTHCEWVPNTGPCLLYNSGLNRHLGSRGIIFLGRVQDIEGESTAADPSIAQPT